MATTSGNLVAGTATAGQGGKGSHGGRGWRAALAAGVVALGCAAALTLGGLRAGDGGRPQAAGPAPAISQASGTGQQRFLERNLQLPSAGAMSPVSSDRQRFLELNELPASAPGPAVSSEASTAQVAGRGRQRFLEMNDLPGAALGWTDARDYAPAAAPATTSGRQQAELYAIEVRDNGAGTTSGDSGPCRSPGASCDR